MTAVLKRNIIASLERARDAELSERRAARQKQAQEELASKQQKEQEEKEQSEKHEIKPCVVALEREPARDDALSAWATPPEVPSTPAALSVASAGVIALAYTHVTYIFSVV